MPVPRLPSLLSAALPGPWLAAALIVLAGCDPNGATGDPGDAVIRGGQDPRATLPPRPHVVVYMIDTLRADRLGAYGHDGGTSPRIDALAGDAALFERAQAPAPWTLPSCVSLQTSSFPMNHGVVSARHSAADELTTLTEFMQGRGYLTAGFIHNQLGGSQGGLAQGYDHLVEKPQARELTPEDRAAGLHTLRPFFEWLRGQDGTRPLYAYIHTIEPHHPYDGHPDFGPPISDERRQRLNKLLPEHRGRMGQLDPARPDPAEVALIAELETELRAALPELWQLYDGDVLTADENVGQVIDALQANGLWEDTIFIVLSDHGEEFLEHGNWFHDHSLYQELLAVPLIVRAPGLTDGGRRVDVPVSLVDVAPTLADLLGEPADPLWLGRSLLPALRGETLSQAPVWSQRVNLDRKVAGIRALRGDQETARLEGDTKAVLHHEVDRMSLFDLGADAGEQLDLAPADAARVAALRAAIEAWGREQARTPFPRRLEKQLDDELLGLLRELGYVDADVGAPR